MNALNTILQWLLSKACYTKKTAALTPNANFTSGTIKARRVGDEVQLDSINLRSTQTGTMSIINGYLEEQFRPKEYQVVLGIYIPGSGNGMPAILEVQTNGYLQVQLNSAPAYGLYASARYVGGGAA